MKSVSNKLEAQLRIQLMSQLGDQLNGQLWDQIWDQPDQLWELFRLQRFLIRALRGYQ